MSVSSSINAANPGSLFGDNFDEVRIPPSCPRPLSLHNYQWALLKLGHVKDSKMVAFNQFERSQMPQGQEPLLTPIPPVSWDPWTGQYVDRADNKTDFRWDQELFTKTNLPEELYVLERPSHVFRYGDLNEPRNKEYPIYGKILRDIPCLPDHISSKISGWLIEFWARIEPRLIMTDISDRMHPEFRLASPNFLSQRRVRFRKSHNLLAWSNATDHASGLADIQQILRKNGIDPARNSTRGLTPGLVDPAVPDGPQIQGGRPRDSTVERRPDWTNGNLVKASIDHIWTPSLLKEPPRPGMPYYALSVWMPPELAPSFLPSTPDPTSTQIATPEAPGLSQQDSRSTSGAAWGTFEPSMTSSGTAMANPSFLTPFGNHVDSQPSSAAHPVAADFLPRWLGPPPVHTLTLELPPSFFNLDAPWDGDTYADEKFWNDQSEELANTNGHQNAPIGAMAHDDEDRDLYGLGMIEGFKDFLIALAEEGSEEEEDTKEEVDAEEQDAEGDEDPEFRRGLGVFRVRTNTA